MIIHVTREICQVVVFGANGNDAVVRDFFQKQEFKSEIARRPFDPSRLSQEELSKKLLGAIQTLAPGEAIELFIH